MAEHTPTPWVVRPLVRQGMYRDGHYLAPNQTCPASAWASNSANAVFIVKAVNSHDQLMALVGWVDSWVSNPVGSYSVAALDGLFGMTRDKIAALSSLKESK